MFFGIKCIEQFISGKKGCDELRHILNVTVSIIFYVTVIEHILQGP